MRTVKCRSRRLGRTSSRLLAGASEGKFACTFSPIQSAHRSCVSAQADVTATTTADTNQGHVVRTWDPPAESSASPLAQSVPALRVKTLRLIFRYAAERLRFSALRCLPSGVLGAAGPRTSSTSRTCASSTHSTGKFVTASVTEGKAALTRADATPSVARPVGRPSFGTRCTSLRRSILRMARPLAAHGRRRGVPHEATRAEGAWVSSELTERASLLFAL
jgi:hypothetical protein